MNSAGRRISLTIELQPEGERIAGSMRIEDGAEQGFRGWLELAAALEEARGGEPPPAPQPGGGGEG